MEGNFAKCGGLGGGFAQGGIRAVLHQRYDVAVGMYRILVEGVYLLQIVFLKRGRLKMVCVVD